jgi:hypothetical protein
MASVAALPELRVAVASVDAQESLTPLHSVQCGGLPPHTTLHRLEVTGGTRFAVVLTFDLHAMRVTRFRCVEVSLNFDGFYVAHRFITITKIVRNGGQLVFKTFADGFTGMSRTAEFRRLTPGMISCLVPMVRTMTDRA